MKPFQLIPLLATAAFAAPLPESLPLPVVQDTGKAPVTVECFSGRSVQIPAAFIADPKSRQQWFADAYLDGGKLGALLARAIPFRPASPDISPYLAVGSFDLPEILATTAKPLLLRLVLTAGPPDSDRRPFGSIAVRITPRDLLQRALTARLESLNSPLRLTVFGPTPGPREMLAAWKIPYHDAGAEPPGTSPTGTILLGETADITRLPTPTPGASVFVLTADPRLESDTEIRHLGEAHFTFVRKTAADWKSDPRLHRLLVSHLSSR